MTQCSKELKLEEFKKGQIIWEQGESGSKFYLIIKGAVDVYVNKEETLELTFGEYLLYLKQNLNLIKKINGQEFNKVCGFKYISNL